MQTDSALFRFRAAMLLFIVGLVISGVTAFGQPPPLYSRSPQPMIFSLSINPPPWINAH
jgi:hypothetical protein